MTIPNGLELLWASTGGQTNPGEDKYKLGWVGEIPSFQNFNYVLANLDKAKLSYAEADIFPWNPKIAYVAGARVVQGDRTFYCKTDHNSKGTEPVDPLKDTTNSYWVSGVVFSSKPNAFKDLSSKDGVLVDEVCKKTDSSKWEGNDLTLKNLNSIISLNTTGTDSNLLLGNVGGELLVVDVGDVDSVDGRVISAGETNKSYRIYHEGNKPKQSDVDGTIPNNPEDGRLYARRNGNWTEVTTTIVKDAPPPPVRGNGQGWYNLEDGQYYVDIDDGDSSQWVPANPPSLPEMIAQNVKYTDKNSLGSDNVQDAIDKLASRPKEVRPNLFINGDCTVWQRGNSWSNAIFGQYVCDRWLVAGNGATIGGNRFNDPEGRSYIAIFGKGVDSYQAVGQRIEAASLAHQSDDEHLTVSFSVTSVAGDTNNAIWCQVHSANAVDDFSAITSIGNRKTQPYKGDGGVQRFAFTFDLSGSKYHNGVEVRFGTFNSADVNQPTPVNLGITAMKCEFGREETGFIPDDPHTNLSKCQRYYFHDTSFFNVGLGNTAPYTAMVQIGTPAPLRTAVPWVFESAGGTNTANIFQFVGGESGNNSLIRFQGTLRNKDIAVAGDTWVTWSANAEL